MKNSILLILIVCLFSKAGGQSQLGLEQYYYFGRGENLSLVTIGYYQNSHNWYGEVRYNYEERQTMSVYAGKSFYGEGRVSYAITPMIGVLLGQYKGGAFGSNIDIGYEKLAFSTQSQYIFSTNDKTKNFLLNWTELSYQLFRFMETGVALQQSTVYRSALKMEAGGFAAFSYKNWELPLYVFSPFSKERNYVIGISWEWQHHKSNNNRGPAPSLKGRRNAGIE